MKKAESKFGRWALTSKLIVAFLLPTLLLFGLFAFFVYQWSEHDLEVSLGRRLTDVARTSTTTLKGEYLLQLSPGDEEDLRYTSSLGKLHRIQKLAEVEKVYVFDKDYKSIVDTSSDAIGGKIYKAELDRVEIQRVFSNGDSVASLLFEGLDGTLHKTGYAPIFRDSKSKDVALVLGVDAPANYFDQLGLLKKRLLIYGVALFFLVVFVAMLFASRLTKPLRLLADESEKIGKGNLTNPIAVVGGDEIGRLAFAMESMRQGVAKRDERSQMMMAGIAHEVRNPLGGIELYTGILRDELKDDPEKSGFVAKIDRELKYLKKVVEEFLSYAKHSTIEPVSTDLHGMLKELLDLVGPEIKKNEIDFSFVGEPVNVDVDPKRFRRALLNVLQNAIQAASGTPPALRVAIEVYDNEVWLDVHNSGPGIDPKVKAKLFEPFFTTKQKGTGLGLAFVKDIVDEHGIELEILEPEHGGTCFRFKWPKVVA